MAPVKGIAKTVASDVERLTNKAITYAFTTGILVALLIGIAAEFIPENSKPFLVSLLVLAGIAVGFFNIHPEEAKDYVVLVTALVIVTSLSKGILGAVQGVGVYLESVLSSILAFILPSALIVAVRSILNLTKR
ncbi:hypothetical protein HYX12_04360 [Candidatus Woesearchaeota archaeon]|nr:hypothetical protein [Candidatus Woesearchaeota archaeon]